MSESISLLFPKEGWKWIDLNQRATWVNRSFFRANRIRWNNCCFHHVFDSFTLVFPLLCTRANRSRCSSLRQYFLKSNGSDLLLENSESLFRSFAHIKRAIRLKNQNQLPALTNTHYKFTDHGKKRCNFEYPFPSLLYYPSSMYSLSTPPLNIQW